MGTRTPGEGIVVTAEQAGVLFAFAVCSLALYKLLFGVDTRPLQAKRKAAPTREAPPPAAGERSPSDAVVRHSCSAGVPPEIT
jgi:hypothetical protein